MLILTYAGLTAYAFAPRGRVSRRADALRAPVEKGLVTLVQQAPDLLFAPAPLDLLIVKARLKVDRRVLIGVTLKPARLTAKRLLRGRFFFDV